MVSIQRKRITHPTLKQTRRGSIIDHDNMLFHMEQKRRFVNCCIAKDVQYPDKLSKKPYFVRETVWIDIQSIQSDEYVVDTHHSLFSFD